MKKFRVKSFSDDKYWEFKAETYRIEGYFVHFYIEGWAVKSFNINIVGTIMEV